MHGSLPLSFCASMFDCVFSTMIYVALLATSLTPSSTIIFPFSGKMHSKIQGSRLFLTLCLLRIAWGHRGELLLLNMHFSYFVVFLHAGKNLLRRILGAWKHISWFSPEVDGFRIYVGKQGICNTASIRRHARIHTGTHTHKHLRFLSRSGGTFSHVWLQNKKIKLCFKKKKKNSCH